MIKFTACLNDLWDYFFLGDPENLSKFKLAHQLSDDLITEFTENESGDLVVKEGVLIPLCGIENYPYHIFFQVNTEESVFKDEKNDLQFKKTGYMLEVINHEIYLMTVPYLKQWTQEHGINHLKSNGIRPKVALENGIYQVEILGGETKQADGWEPTIEFILKSNVDKKAFDVEDISFRFKITSKDY